MDFKNIEQTIKDYYFHKSKINGYYNKIEILEKHIYDLKHTLKTNNFTLNVDLSNIQLRDKVQSNRISSLDDKLIKAYDEVQNEIKRKQTDALDNKVKIMKIEEDITLVDSFIMDLSEEDRGIIEKLYKYRMGVIMASMELNMSRSALHSKRNKILNELGKKIVM